MRENFLNSMKNHNENYTELLNAYVDNANKSLKNKRSFKSIFFTICCIIMLSITITTVVLTIVGIKSDTKTGNLAVSLGANLLSFLASFIVLPKIIASYLFNNEDAIVFDLKNKN